MKKWYDLLKYHWQWYNDDITLYHVSCFVTHNSKSNNLFEKTSYQLSEIDTTFSFSQLLVDHCVVCPQLVIGLELRNFAFVGVEPHTSSPKVF